RSLPKFLACRRLARLGANRVDPAKHTRDVAIKNRRSLVIRDRRDGAGGVSADAWQAQKLPEFLRDAATVLVANPPRRRAEIACAGVVSKSLPGPQDVDLVRRRQRFDRGITLEKPQEIWHNRGDLRLLKHRLA